MDHPCLHHDLRGGRRRSGWCRGAWCRGAWVFRGRARCGIDRLRWRRLGRGRRQFLFGGQIDHVLVHLFGTCTVGRQKGVVANLVDQSRGPLAHSVDEVDGARREQLLAGAAGHLQPMQDVPFHMLPAQGRQVKAAEQALIHRFELRTPEPLAKLGLAQNADLQQFGVVGLQVAEHAKLFEALVRQVLGFVQHDDGESILGELLQQEVLQSFGQLQVIGVRRDVQLELGADGGQELSPGQVRVRDDGDGSVAIHLAQEHTADQGFTCTDLTGHQDESLTLERGVLQGGQGFFMLRRAVVEGRVRRVVERRPVQAEMRAVHASDSFFKGPEVRSDHGPWVIGLLVNLSVQAVLSDPDFRLLRFYLRP